MSRPLDTLWESEPRTLIKHQLYRHYLQCWMGKICRRFEISSIVDAFAGPGEYRDGPDGSPIVIAKTYLEHSQRPAFQKLNIVCLEERQDRYEHLRQRIAQLPGMPKLRIQPLYGQVAESVDRLADAAHPRSSPNAPTLWILDPFGYGDVPFELIRSCLAKPHDEVLVTWFADEIYRFCEDPTKAAALTRHFGGDHWRNALTHRGESNRKVALRQAYEDGLKRELGVQPSSFSISGKNETDRYSLIFATHSDKGLECFNPVRWRLDPMQGAAINERRGLHQGDLFADQPMISPLRQHLETLAGQAVPLAQLARDAGRLGFTEAHLRLVLGELAREGRAVREEPLQARSRWPETCKIRFYGPQPTG